MQAKKNMLNNGEAVVPKAAKTGDPSTQRAWHTPVFERISLKKACSNYAEKSGYDGLYSS